MVGIKYIKDIVNLIAMAFSNDFTNPVYTYRSHMVVIGLEGYIDIYIRRLRKTTIYI